MTSIRHFFHFIRAIEDNYYPIMDAIPFQNKLKQVPLRLQFGLYEADFNSYPNHLSPFKS